MLYNTKPKPHENLTVAEDKRNFNGYGEVHIIFGGL